MGDYVYGHLYHHALAWALPGLGYLFHPQITVLGVLVLVL